MATLTLCERGEVEVEIEAVDIGVRVVVVGGGLTLRFTLPRESAEAVLYSLSAALEIDDAPNPKT